MVSPKNLVVVGELLWSWDVSGFPLWWSRSLERHRPEWTPRPPTTWQSHGGMLTVSEGREQEDSVRK